MTPNPDRRNAMRLSLHVAALNSIPFSTAQGAADQKPKENDSMTNDPTHDFDLFFGSWRAQHRRLKARLANNNEWIEFDGTSTMQPLLGGYGNMDDNGFNMPGGACRGVSVRAFDPKTKTWETNWITNFKKLA